MSRCEEELLEAVERAERVLVGIGEEWRIGQSQAPAAYAALGELLKGRDYFIITSVTDGVILESPLDARRIVAPCGNETWRQCSRACTKEIWEPQEVPDERCPHCGAPLTGNTVEAEIYIEEGYLPQWKAYTKWLSETLNKELIVLELGVGFGLPSLIRWPFEKTVYFNKKAYMYRVHHKFSQVPEEIAGKAAEVTENSVEFVNELVGQTGALPNSRIGEWNI